MNRIGQMLINALSPDDVIRAALDFHSHLEQCLSVDRFDLWSLRYIDRANTVG